MTSVKKSLGVASCMVLVAGTCSATPITLPTEYPINMGFKTLYSDPITGDGSTAGNESFDNVGNAANFAIHHGYLSDMNAIKSQYPNSGIITILANPPTTIYVGSDSGTTKVGTVFPGHFLYYAGTTATASINSTATQINVADTSIFNVGDYILIRNSLTDWSNFEHAKVTQILSGAITVTRSTNYGTTAKNFSSGAYIAPHVAAWTTSTDMSYRLNYSLHAPTDSQGHKANYWAAQLMGTGLNSQTQHQGMEHDVILNSYYHYARPIDANNDGTGDWGSFNGINSFGLGIQEYAGFLRTQLTNLGSPDKIVQFDSDSPLRGYRGFNYVNGVQMETFMDNVNTDGGRFSEAYEHLSHWVQKAQALPKFSYGYNRIPTATYHSNTSTYAPDSAFRRHFAVGLMVGMPHPYGSGDDMGIFDWSEQRGGGSNYKWLGAASGAASREVPTDTTNHLQDATWELDIASNYTVKLDGNIASDGASYVTDGSHSIEIAGVPSGTKPNDYGVGLLLSSTAMGNLTIGQEYTLTFDAKASDSFSVQVNGETHNFSNTPFQIHAGNFGGYDAWVLADGDWRTYTLSFTATNYPRNIKLGISETLGTVYFRNIKFQYGTANRLSRTFANGKAFLNMSDNAWTIDSTTRPDLLPASNPYYDLQGNKIGSSFTVPAKDAVFFKKTAN